MTTRMQQYGAIGDVSASGSEVQILLIGKTGNGKSTVGNTILGREVFKTGRSMTSTTVASQEGETKRGNVRVKVVDTPDITNLEMEDPNMQQEVIRWKSMLSSYASLVLLCVRCDVRYTQEEYAIYRKIKDLWGDDSLCERLAVAFTFGDRQDRDIVEELKTACQELKNVLKDARQTYFVFNAEAETNEKEAVVAEVLQRVSRSPPPQADNKLSDTESPCCGRDFVEKTLLLIFVLIFAVYVVLAIDQDLYRRYSGWYYNGVAIFEGVLGLSLLVYFILKIKGASARPGISRIRESLSAH